MKHLYLIGRDEIPSDIVLTSQEEHQLILLALPGVSADVPVNIRLAGEGAVIDVFGLYLNFGKERVSFRVNLRHESGHCRSRQLFKGIVGAEAQVEFDGLIYVAKGAQKTSAFQENHSILLSDRALVQTRPQLEIYADDVECSHGATIGKLSEDELFYMRSRGIPEKEARALQMRSFISAVVERIEDEQIRQMIYDKLSQCQA